MRSNSIKCTACSGKKNSKAINDAEMLHPVLNVPICNACFLSYKQSEQQLQVIDVLTQKASAKSEESKLQDFQAASVSSIKEQQEINKSFCVWCGFGDGCELFLCDSCTACFCSDCVSRNFGQLEMKRVRKLEIWFCYICKPTPLIEGLRSGAYKNADGNTSSSVAESVQAYNSLEKVIFWIVPTELTSFWMYHLSRPLRLLRSKIELNEKKNWKKWKKV